MVNKSLLYTKRDLDKNHIDAKEIYGYKLVENKSINYYTKKHKLVNDEDLRKIKKMLILKNENIEAPNKLIGYLELKKNDILLKLRDTINQGSKGTQIKTGSVCGNEGMKKGKIIDFLQYSSIQHYRFLLVVLVILPGYLLQLFQMILSPLYLQCFLQKREFVLCFCLLKALLICRVPGLQRSFLSL